MYNTPDWLVYVLSLGVAAFAIWAGAKRGLNAKIARGIVLVTMLPFLMEGSTMMDPSMPPILRAAYRMLIPTVMFVGIGLWWYGVFETIRANRRQSGT